MLQQIKFILLVSFVVLAIFACSEAKKSGDVASTVLAYDVVEDPTKPDAQPGLTKEISALVEKSTEDEPSCTCEQESKSKKSDSQAHKLTKVGGKKLEKSKIVEPIVAIEENSKPVAEKIKDETKKSVPKENPDETKVASKETEDVNSPSSSEIAEEEEEVVDVLKLKESKNSLVKDKKVTKKGKYDKRSKREATKSSKKSKKVKVSKKTKGDNRK